jgi:hypothetical protein
VTSSSNQNYDNTTASSEHLNVSSNKVTDRFATEEESKMTMKDIINKSNNDKFKKEPEKEVSVLNYGTTT